MSVRVFSIPYLFVLLTGRSSAVPTSGEKYAKIRGSAYRMHSIMCLMKGYSAEYVDLVTYFGVLA
jgi:hypothetical protein